MPLQPSHTSNGPIPECISPSRKRACSGWSIVAYGHYPLEVISHPDTGPWWPWGVVHPRHKVGMPPDLRHALLKHNVTAYLNGHLHSAFGDKLHRMHRRGVDGASSSLCIPGAKWCNLLSAHTHRNASCFCGEPAGENFQGGCLQEWISFRAKMLPLDLTAKPLVWDFQLWR